VPSGPGLGIELDEVAVNRLRRDGKPAANLRVAG
jgi:L-alanine-DL-glutamate epimerase-like enolase superfamily enzyme